MLEKKTLQTHRALGLNEARITRASHVSTTGKDIFLLLPCQLHVHRLSFPASTKCEGVYDQKENLIHDISQWMVSPSLQNNLPSLSPLLFLFLLFPFLFPQVIRTQS